MSVFNKGCLLAYSAAKYRRKKKGNTRKNALYATGKCRFVVNKGVEINKIGIE